MSTQPERTVSERVSEPVSQPVSGPPVSQPVSQSPVSQPVSGPPVSQPVSQSPVSQEDVAVSLAVARDLGPGSEVAVVTEFLDRVGPAIDARVDARVEARLARTHREAPPRSGQPLLAFASVLAGIPITAITLGATDGGLTGLLTTAVAWTGLAAVNGAAGLRRG